MTDDATSAVRLLLKWEFPPLLEEIPQSPKELRVRGVLPSFDKRWLAVVGSRAMSPYGRQACDYLIKGLAGYPVVIVSGLAYGVDAQAHRSALDAGLPTVGVPGSGLDWDVMYPKANVKLAHEILEKGGALLSEEKSDAKTMDHMFPKRNRIMAGMCHATLVIEAREKSGSLITAKYTTDYNRDLLVVPGSIFSAESKGTHQFLRLGAVAVTTPEDILQALGITPSASNVATRADLSSNEIRVVELIATPLPRDELIRSLAMPTAEANALLSMMEIKGIIIEDRGVFRVR